MKTVFLRRTGVGKLLVFFNGWSRDERDVAALSASTDVLEVHDYTDLRAAELLELLRPYPERHLAAWSLGVWAAALALADTGLHFASALALNGTLYPAHVQYGIDPAVFDGTVEHWTEASARERFLRRMTGSAAIAGRLPVPARDPLDQRAELIAIRETASKFPVPRNLYTAAVLGRRDRIVPFAAQRAFWASSEGAAARGIERDLPHYPLAGLTSWEEVCGLADA